MGRVMSGSSFCPGPEKGLVCVVRTSKDRDINYGCMVIFATLLFLGEQSQKTEVWCHMLMCNATSRSQATSVPPPLDEFSAPYLATYMNTRASTQSNPHAHIHANTHVHIHVYTNRNTHAYPHAHMPSMRTVAHAHIPAHIYTHLHMATHMYTCACIYMQMCEHIYSCGHTVTCSHACMHVHTHTMHTYTYMLTSAHPCLHIRIHTEHCLLPCLTPYLCMEYL